MSRRGASRAKKRKAQCKNQRANDEPAVAGAAEVTLRWQVLNDGGLIGGPLLRQHQSLTHSLSWRSLGRLLGFALARSA